MKRDPGPPWNVLSSEKLWDVNAHSRSLHWSTLALFLVLARQMKPHDRSSTYQSARTRQFRLLWILSGFMLLFLLTHVHKWHVYSTYPPIPINWICRGFNLRAVLSCAGLSESPSSASTVPASSSLTVDRGKFFSWGFLSWEPLDAPLSGMMDWESSDVDVMVEDVGWYRCRHGDSILCCSRLGKI